MDRRVYSTKSPLAFAGLSRLSPVNWYQESEKLNGNPERRFSLSERPPVAVGLAGSDSASVACREIARARLLELFPSGDIPVTEHAVDSIAAQEWVTDELVTQEYQDESRCVVGLRSPWLPSRRRDIARCRLGQLYPSASAHLSDDVIVHTAAHDWVIRTFENQTHAAIKEAEQVVAKEAELVRLVTVSEKGYGDEYECGLPYNLSVAEAANIIVVAQRRPTEERAQNTACKVVAKMASISRHFDDESPAKISLTNGDGLAVVLEAMCRFRESVKLQTRACEALWRITDTAAGARAAEEAGAVVALFSTMLRLPKERALQWAACGALANIAKRRERGPLGAYLLETVVAATSAMQNHPREHGVQESACMLLWNLATENPDALAKKPGLRGLVEHAVGLGVKDASLLLESVHWQTEAESQVTCGGGRQRWGQWAVGRCAAA